MRVGVPESAAMLESYITPFITSFLSKYIKNLKPADLQLSFWGGDAVLKNLELQLDAIEEALSGMAPFELKSGSVKQLTVHIPWTSIGSEPIEITFESMECSVKLKDLRSTSQSSKTAGTSGPETPSSMAANPPQAPSYLKGLLNRITNNVVLHVHNLLVKVIEEQCDLLMSVSVKHLQGFTTSDSWEKQFVFTDSLQGDYTLHNVCSVSDMTVCLDLIGSSGQVEVFENPFVPKCSLMCRLARQFNGNALVEAKLDILCEGELQFSVTEQQFSLFLHLLDWLLGMYYSFKKLKGRDDQLDEEEGVKLSKAVSQAHSLAMYSHVAESSQPDESAITAGTQAKETQGWGSWMLSYITGEEGDQSGSAGHSSPTLPPTLCLAVHASSISVAFCSTGQRQQPIFPSSYTRQKHSNQVVLMRFTGCMARLVRAPSSSLLAFSIGIMAVSAWASGSCPCQGQTPSPEKRKVHSPDKSKEQVCLVCDTSLRVVVTIVT